MNAPIRSSPSALGLRQRTPKETNQLVEIVLRHAPSILMAVTVLVAALRLPESCMSSLAAGIMASKIRLWLSSGDRKQCE